MPLVFRGLNRKPSWNKQKHEEEYKDWLPAGEIPAEILVDVVREDIKQNELSIYLINENDDELKRLVAAYAVNRDRPDVLDYKVIDYELLLSFGFSFKKTLGYTADSTVNIWHRDLHHLTIDRLMEFVKLLYNIETKRVSKKDVEKWIVESVRNKYIQLEKVRAESMQNKIRILLEKYSQ